MTAILRQLVLALGPDPYFLALGPAPYFPDPYSPITQGYSLLASNSSMPKDGAGSS